MHSPWRRANPAPHVRTPIWGVRLALSLVVLLTLGACENAGQTTQDKPAAKELDQVAAQKPDLFAPDPGLNAPPPPPPDSPFATPIPAAEGWTIVIASVPGSTRAIGEQMVETVRTRGGLPDAFLAQRHDKLFVAMGSFDNPTSPEAKRTLEGVQQTQVNGTRPYAYAFLAPPPGTASEGSNPAYELRNAKATYGRDALYTLQVGIYGHADGRAPTPEELKLFRESAEQAVRELRAEGELAFYHHGPMRSTVTVGVFGPEDHDASVRPPLESARLEQTRERHPYNLLNGQGIREGVRGADGKMHESMQKSFLVAIPG